MPSSPSIFRFAPSPNGRLHLGHARSALMNAGMASTAGGRLLIRIEDIDLARSSPAYEAAILMDLARLGIVPTDPVRRQSEHFSDYAAALDRLKARGLVYPAFLSRADIKRLIAEHEAHGSNWPRDPDGAPLYPGNERDVDPGIAARRMAAGEQVNWRLDLRRAIDLAGRLTWKESGGEADDSAVDLAALAGQRTFREVIAEPERWGDVIIARADVPTSYHLAVVVDDALQGVTDVVRGADLYHATSVHRLLQTLLGLPAPRYHHHALVRDASGRKLAKSHADAAISALLDQGLDAALICRLAGLR